LESNLVSIQFTCELIKGKDMPKQIHLLIAAVLFTLISTQTDSSDAQNLRSRQPLQAGFRWLGQGWSAGYHHRDPGPNTDYYNPWTAHNSMLISKMPGYQDPRHSQYGNQYGHPNASYQNYSDHSNWDQDLTQSIEPTFIPTDADPNEEPDDEDDTSNDFDTGDSSDDDSDFGSDENADFEDSSFDDDDAFDKEDSAFDDFDSDFESEAGSSSKTPEAGSGTKTSGSGTKSSGSGAKASKSGSGTKATKTGFSRLEPGSFDAMDLNSFIPN